MKCKEKVKWSLKMLPILQINTQDHQSMVLTHQNLHFTMFAILAINQFKSKARILKSGLTLVLE